MTAITPTIGRKMWFWLNGSEGAAFPSPVQHGQPLDVNVVYVHSPSRINVAGFDAHGDTFSAHSIYVRQSDEAVPASGTAYVEWMPYQVGQARAAA